ncbi:Cytochrome p450 86a2, partial [Globisporangium splendens]
MESSPILLLLGLAVATKALWQLYQWFTLPSGVRKSLALPKPKGTLPLLGNTPQTALHYEHIHDWFLEQSELRDGKPFLLDMVGRHHQIVVATPEFFEDINKTHFDAFDKGPMYAEIMRDVLGDGIFAVDGDKWQHQRKTLSHMFSLRGLRDNLTKSVHTNVVKFYKFLEDAAAKREHVDLGGLFYRFSMETFVDFGLGVQLGTMDSLDHHPFSEAFDNAERILLYRFFRPRRFWHIQRWLNVGVEKELKDAIAVIDKTVLDIIAQSLKNRNTNRDVVNKKKDIVSLFINSFDHNNPNEVFDPVALRDIVVSILVAGRDSTASTLGWFFYRLSKHPGIENKIRQELLEQAPALMRGEVAALSMEDSQKLVYLEATLRETLRLHPAVPMNVKHANRDVVLHDGTFVPAGWSVIYSSYTMARMESVWGPDAKEFEPKRWIDSETGKLLTFSPFKFTSFHGGSRICLGMNMAIMEMRMVASGLLSRFRFRMVPGQNVTYDFSLLLPIKGPLNMIVDPVPPATA